MKKLSALIATGLVAILASASIKAQNIQLHYDLGRNITTSTIEMFRADNGGSCMCNTATPEIIRTFK